MSNADSESNTFIIDKIQDIDKERLFKMAFNEESEANTLLAYYRDRINAFDKEREEWLHKLELVKMSQEEHHRQTWELQKRRDEIAELQKSLSESKLSLYTERQLVLKLARENDQLKVKELEDRRKIAELMSFNEPVEQDVVFYKDLRPETIHRYVKNDLSLNKNKEAFETALKKYEDNSGFTKSGSIKGGAGKSVIKTIYLPNEQMNSVALESENLRRQLEQERQAYAEEVKGLREEIRTREEETRRRFESDHFKIKELTERNQKLEKDNVQLSKEYFALRLKLNDTEKRLHEELEVLRLKNSALANKFKIYKKQAETENAVSKDLAEKKAEEYSNKFRNQIRQKDENLTVLKDQYSQVQQIYLSKVKELEENLTKLAQRYQALENRRILEKEGFQTDIKTLKKRIKELESTQSLRKSSSKLDGSKKKASAAARRQEEENEEDEEEVDEDEEDEDEAATVDSEELDLIKKQLADLETKLDRSKKNREI